MSDYLAAAVSGVESAVARARELGVRVAVVVIDRTTTPVAVQRIDGSYPSTVDVARAKAHTAFNFGAPTTQLAERISPDGRAALQGVVPQLVFVGGGMPLTAGDELVGAVGVSGPSADQDHECAELAAAMMSAALNG